MNPNGKPKLPKFGSSIFHNLSVLHEAQGNGSKKVFGEGYILKAVQKIYEVNYRVNNKTADTFKWDEIQTNKHARVACRYQG